MTTATRRDAIPAELRDIPHWVTFRLTRPAGATKLKKVPFVPGSDRHADVSDATTWGSFAEAVADVERRQRTPEADPTLIGYAPGLGLTPAMNYTLIDDDQGRGVAIDSYTERSIGALIGGQGTHVITAGRPPEGFTVPAGLEVYPRTGNRFVVLTGDIIDGRDTIRDCTEDLARLFPPRPQPRQSAPFPATDEPDDTEAIERVRRMTKGRQLFDTGDITGYPSGSEADLALLNCFVKAGITCPDRLEALYEQSALDNPHWQHAGYRQRTIGKALDGTVAPWEGWIQEPVAIVTPRKTEPPAGEDRDLRAENAALRERVTRLEAELERCSDDRADLRRQVADARAGEAQAKRDLAAVVQTLANTNLGGDAAGKALVLAAAEVQHRAHTVPPGDGYVQVNASRVADATVWIDGEPTPAPARVSPRTVTKYVGLAAEAGLIPAKKDEIPAPPGKPSIKNEGWYWRAAPTLADQLAPLTTGSVYSDDNPRPLRGGDPAKRRRLKKLPGCPECGGYHVACTACGVTFDTPAAVDLDSGKTLNAADLPTEDRRPTVPPVDGDDIHTPVVAVRMSTSLPTEPRAHTVPPEKRERRARAAADLASREPAWLADAPDPWEFPPQPALFVPPDPPRHSSHFDVGD